MINGEGHGKRQLTVAVAGAAVASAVVLLAASRTWLVEVTVRPAPLPPVSVERTGASLVPALPAIALVALAGTGAVLATRGLARRIVGVLVACSGLAMTGMTAMIAMTAKALGESGWVVVAAVGGLGVAAAGLFTLRYGAAWPGMGARYQRGAPRPRGDRQARADGAGGADGGRPGRRPAEAGADRGRNADMSWWDAIDRGEDPTKK